MEVYEDGDGKVWDVCVECGFEVRDEKDRYREVTLDGGRVYPVHVVPPCGAVEDRRGFRDAF